MKEADLQEIAVLLAEIVSAGASKPKGAWREQVKAFRSRFTDMHYCFKPIFDTG